MNKSLNPLEKDTKNNTKKIIGRLILFSLLVFIAYYISLKDYFFIHNLFVICSGIFGFSICIIVKDTYRVSKNRNFLFLGIAFLGISLFDFFHILMFYNNIILDAVKYNAFIQYYLAGRYMQAAAFLSFSFLVSRKSDRIKVRNLLIFYYVVFTIILFFIYKLNFFPQCYDKEVGITQFKNLSEYIICIVLLLATVILANNRNKMHKNVYKYLLISIVCMMVSQLFFAVYEDYMNSMDIFAHVFKLTSYYFIYKAIVETTLERPYEILFYKLMQSNSDLGNRTIELEKINKKLNESKKNYQALLDFLPYAIFAHYDNKLVFVNNAALKLLEYDKYSEILGRDVEEFIHNDYHDAVKKRIDMVYNKSIPTELIEMKMITKGGRYIDVETKSVPYLFKDKKACLVVAGDIRERKKVEEKEKALKEAKEYDRIKNEFMANISHELRTPLNVIFGAVQLIEYYSANNIIYENKQNISRYAKDMRHNCYRMLRIVNNLIDLTRIDSGVMKLNMQNHNIVSVVEDITLSAAQYIQDKDISIQFDTEVEERYLACDVYAIERIILNLLSNAVKFTNKGGFIWVNIYDKDDYVLIAVKDTGIGIPEDKLEVVFERFRQVDKSFARNTEGSGIGLSLVKSLVELHGGSISLKSKIQEGSEFIIKLPINLVAEDEVAATKDMPQENDERIHIEFSDIYS